MRKSRRRPRQRLNLQRKPNKSSEAEITVEIGLPSSKVADTVYDAVRPETLQSPGYRSRTIVRKKGRVLIVTIKARDLIALRAASNSFLRFIDVAAKAVDVVAPFYRAGRADMNSKAERATF